jgi:hypothetical protein
MPPFGGSIMLIFRVNVMMLNFTVKIKIGIFRPNSVTISDLP